MKITDLFKSAPWKRTLFFIVADALIFYLSFYLAYLLRFNLQIPPEHILGASSLVFIIVGLKIVSMYLLRVYEITWRYFILSDGKKILYALLLSYLLFIAYLFFWYHGAFPRTVVMIDFLLSFFLLLSLRLSKRLVAGAQIHEDRPRTLFIGANQRTLSLISSAKNGEIAYQPVSIVDEDANVVGTYMASLKVSGMEDLEQIVADDEIESAIITLDLEPSKMDALFEKLSSLGITHIKRSKLLGDKNEKLIDISIEDLLARRPKDLDLKAIETLIRDRRILITGAGGSIGSEIARQCERFGAKELILLDHSEYNLYAISEQIQGVSKISLMQSVVDRKLLEKTFATYRPEIVIHAAAYKHVPLCEENQEGAILNNVIGTKNTIDLAIKYGTDRFVLISTDKAVRPTNIMGATKRVCELYAQNVPSGKTLITGVRFGNVLGSSGSVIPKFKRLIEANRPLAVTHPEITRYFMLIPEACQLVLQAAAIAKERELFVLDMGEPIKIVDLARKMLKLYDKEHLGIEFTGLRAGEKLYEELLLNDDDKKTTYDSIFVAKPTPYAIDRLNSDIENLLQSDDKIEALKRIVPEFEHKEMV